MLTLKKKESFVRNLLDRLLLYFFIIEKNSESQIDFFELKVSDYITYLYGFEPTKADL